MSGPLGVSSLLRPRIAKESPCRGYVVGDLHSKRFHGGKFDLRAQAVAKEDLQVFVIDVIGKVK